VAERRQKRVLVIGPVPADEEFVSGIQLSFASMLEALLREPSLEVVVHDLSVTREGRSPLRQSIDEARVFASLVGRITTPWSRFDAVLFNTSAGGLLRSGGIVRSACKARGVPLMVRVFGGDLDLLADEASERTRQTFERSTLMADRVLLQTHSLCERFKSSDDCRRVRWWPTTRNATRFNGARPDQARRFLYLGPIRPEKGILEAVEASKRLPDGASLTLVGPHHGGFTMDGVDLGDRCQFLEAPPEGGVEEVLRNHDVLVFPSYHKREGMPGVILEAMQSGLPVISTRWRAIPELVEDGDNGVLVAPRCPNGLGAAMRRLIETPTLFRRLREGARITGERFRSVHWEPKLVRWIHELVEERSSPMQGDRRSAS
jgi:glycosyltransferase involved in cell wall biosynthesis